MTHIIEIRAIPLARQASVYLEADDITHCLSLVPNSNFVKLSEKMRIDGYDEHYRVISVYEVVGGTKMIHYQYDIWAGVKHLSERLKAELPTELPEVFA